MTTTSQKVARYTVELYITRPVDADDDSSAYINQTAKTELEREILKALRKLDGDCDCEVMTAGIGGEEV